MSVNPSDIFTTGNYGYDLSPEAVERMKHIEEVQRSRTRHPENPVADMHVYANQLFDNDLQAKIESDLKYSSENKSQENETGFIVDNTDGFRTIQLDIEEPQTKNPSVISRLKSLGDHVGQDKSLGRRNDQGGLVSRTKSAVREKLDGRKKARNTSRRESNSSQLSYTNQ